MKMRVFRSPCLAVMAILLMPAAFAQDGEDSDWPQEIVSSEARILIYQPQVEDLTGDILRSRAAVSVLINSRDEPVFGAIWVELRLETDRDARTAELSSVRIIDVRFPESTPEQQARFREIVEAEIMKRDLVLSLDRLLASLEAVRQEQQMAEELKTDPPKIIFVNHPAVLILVDGEPVLRKIEESSLMRVVNTPYLMVFHPPSRGYYLNAGADWYEAADVQGEWKPVTSLPQEVAALVPPEAVTEAGLEKSRSDYQLPRVLVETEPAELIATKGEPAYKPFPGNALLYVTNTESDLVLEVATQQHYVLLAGRWFRSKSLQNGSWTYVRPDQLPQAFASIPAGSEKAHLRAHVAGTQEARDAVMDAQIPQTAAVDRATAKLDVEYDGQPKFQEVDGTNMQYATNTSTAVFKSGNTYYSCEQGVWFKSSSPEGPWEVADSVPAEVRKIPPSNPHYNVKHVYIYDVTPKVVYVGYTPGYVGCYPHYGTVIYGTGWYYRPWISPYHYYPHHWTFGFSVRYNPWTGGWGFGVSVGRGPFHFSFAWGSGWYGGPWWGPRPGWWGPGGYWGGYHHGFRAGYWAGRASRYPRPVPYRNPRIHSPAARPLPARGGAAAAQLPSNNLYARAENRQRLAPDQRPARPAQRPSTRENRRNDVYVGGDGNVYRRNRDGWQKRESGGWRPQPGTARPSQPSTRPTQPAARPSQPSTRPSQPSARPSQPSTRPTPSRPSTSGLDREYRTRQRGASRTQTYQRSRPSTGSRSRPSAAPRGRRR